MSVELGYLRSFPERVAQGDVSASGPDYIKGKTLPKRSDEDPENRSEEAGVQNTLRTGEAAPLPPAPHKSPG